MILLDLQLLLSLLAIPMHKNQAVVEENPQKWTLCRNSLIFGLNFNQESGLHMPAALRQQNPSGFSSLQCFGEAEQ